MFTPAPFELIEFDDTRTPSESGAIRWLPGWQGRADQPAEEVCLGWVGSEGRQAVVTTALLSRHGEEHLRRQNALLLLFGGDQLRTRSRPTGAAASHTAIAALAHDENGWTSQNIAVDDVPTDALTTHIGETVLGYLAVGDRLVCFAAVNTGPSSICLKALTVTSAASYLANPTQPISNDDLAAQARLAASARDDRYR